MKKLIFIATLALMGCQSKQFHRYEYSGWLDVLHKSGVHEQVFYDQDGTAAPEIEVENPYITSTQCDLILRPMDSTDGDEKTVGSGNKYTLSYDVLSFTTIRDNTPKSISLN